MSRYIATRAIRGANALVMEAETMLHQALAEKGPDTPVAFPNTAYYLPVIYSLICLKVETLEDIKKPLDFARGLLPPHVRTLLLSATVGNAVEFTGWLRKNHQRRLELIQSDDRKVPLTFHWVPDKLLGEQLEEMASGGIDGILEFASRVGSAVALKILAEKILHKTEHQGVITGIADLNDESDRRGMRIVITLKKDAHGQVVLNQLYKHTYLQSTFGVNNLALVVWALLSAEDDFSAAIGEAVAAGWDTDCNGATVGALWALQEKPIPEAWTAPWQGLVRVSLAGEGEIGAGPYQAVG